MLKKPKGSGLAGNLQKALGRRSWPTFSHPRRGHPGALTPSQSSCPNPFLKGVVGRINPTLHGSPEHFLQLDSIEATHSHLEEPVCPKHPWYSKVVQAARYVAERGSIQEESVIFPIQYERPSVCLQRETLLSAEVWSGGVSVCRGDGTRPAHCYVNFTFFLSWDRSDPAPPHPAC